jgi:hypothetical protein
MKEGSKGAKKSGGNDEERFLAAVLLGMTTLIGSSDKFEA